MRNTDSDTRTTDDCCGDSAQESDTEHGSCHRPGRLTVDQQLPDDFRRALGRFVGVDSVDTLAEWSEHIRRQTGGGTVDVDNLCHTSADTAHWGDVDGERYHFQCFYDAVILAALENDPVDVHTVSPDGEVIEAHAVGSETLSVTPETAVFSLGIERDAHKRSGGTPTLEDGYAAICPYVRAFPNREAYESWAADVPAATVATPLSGATAFARALTTADDDD